MWCKIYGDNRFGLYFSHQNMNSTLCVNEMTCDLMNDLTSPVPIMPLQYIWLQDDVQPPHASRRVTVLLYRYFTELYSEDPDVLTLT